MRPDLAPTAVWLAGMLIGLGYTLRAVQLAQADLDRESGNLLLREVAAKNLRSESLRTLTLGAFAVVGMLSFYSQTVQPGEPQITWVRWAFTVLLLTGGLAVTANSVLDARYRERLKAQLLRGER